jgi:hypothetical protein
MSRSRNQPGGTLPGARPADEALKAARSPHTMGNHTAWVIAIPDLPDNRGHLKRQERPTRPVRISGCRWRTGPPTLFAMFVTAGRVPVGVSPLAAAVRARPGLDS